MASELGTLMKDGYDKHVAYQKMKLAAVSQDATSEDVERARSELEEIRRQIAEKTGIKYVPLFPAPSTPDK